MSGVEEFRLRSIAWLDSVAATFGSEARHELSPSGDLALGRRYMAAKYEAGFSGINWPVEFGGQGLSPLHKITFDTEEMRYRMPTGYFSVSIGMPVPVLIRFGQDREWVKQRVIRALRGEEIWCQLFSEPAAGSDLAGLRTRAEPDGNGWKLNGQKLWTSWAQYSDFGVIVARTDISAFKHKGLTYYWVDMKAPGVQVRPIKLAGGDSHVNEVFFDDVKLTDAQRISPVGGGFAVAMATLMIERYAATDSAGSGPHLDLFIELARQLQINGKPALQDGRVRSAISRNYAMRRGLDAITARAMKMMEAGMEPGPEGALNKLFSVRSRQRLSELAIDLQGNTAFAFDPHSFVKEDWTASWLNAPTGRIAGGADEMLLNTIAERILGLPQDYRPDKGVPFNEIPA
ncbi:acyl-CoA dehydrogenase family protein [Novosphingobium sp. Gsoil 351]|uniref:acyl-CoA dehydrogenase family protein n=1 Tax=Novosphingobium sp. Gsoil 351 TaxID=2675225 RepID=UPI0012B4AA81|nr:acyl-CoA dehydrogenase family protein [Novosphingobium sp. Gsoil 351]QGN54182.1 acyl-CoA dehydrogenase [Novosphingobium sp. Gsoil 351]